MSKVWFNDPQELFNKNKIMEFWPDNTQTENDRINSTTRFIIYTTCAIYLMKRDVRIFILAAMVLSVLYVFHKNEMITMEAAPTPMTVDYGMDCQPPTEDNPMANQIYGDSPTRPEACYYPTVEGEVKKYLDDTIPYDCGRSRCPMPKYQRNAAARQFISNPNTANPSAQTEFAEWCYGKKFQPMCKDDPSRCNPNARGVQLEAFAGLDPNGDMRTGMRGGGNGAAGTSS